MTKKTIVYIIIFIGALSQACVQKEPPINEQEVFVLSESSNEDDVAVNSYLQASLQPVRDNYKRINSKTNWDSVKQKDLHQSTEGGTVSYYYSNDQIEKIIVRQYGENNQWLNEYYIVNRELTFVLEKNYSYNRPIYWDSVEMKKNDDSQAFEQGKTEVIEDKSYFKNGKLIYQLNSEDCGAPNAHEYLVKEQGRILSSFEYLLDYSFK